MQDKPIDDIGILLGLAYQSFVDQLNADMAAHGFEDLGRSYGYVFRALAAEPMQLNRLATRLGITNQGTMKLIDEMEARGYVERHEDPQDKRAKLLKLAARGKSAVKCARRFHAAFEERLRAQLGAREIEAWRAVLEHVVAEDIEAASGRLRPM